MSSIPVITLSKEHKLYKRTNVDPIGSYIDQASILVSKRRSISFEKSKEIVKKTLDNNQDKFNNPEVTFFERDQETLDKHVKVETLSKYILYVKKTDYIVAPSGTVYLPAKVRKSHLSSVTYDNSINRGIIKKQAFKARDIDKDKEKYILLFRKQLNKKLGNNIISGQLGSAGSVIYNKSGHSTLTSTTRTVTSLSNSISERFIAGNRHYRDFDITLNNIVSIIATLHNEIGVESFKGTLDKFGIYMPTADETYEVLKESFWIYWRESFNIRKLKDYLSLLDPVELAAIVYVGDFWHLMKFNESFMREFFSKATTRVKGELLEDPATAMKDFPDNSINLLHHMFSHKLKGKGTLYSKMDKQLVSDLYATGINVHNVLSEYMPLFRAIITNSSLPPSAAYIRDMVRKRVVMSDTDSTARSAQDWVEWYEGGLAFTDNSMPVAGLVFYLTDLTLDHGILQISKNLGVAEDKMTTINMKSEFTWQVFCLMSISKHYFSGTNIQEGSVFDKTGLEVKGVNLKNSNTPMFVRKIADWMMLDIIQTLESNQKLTLRKYINIVIYTEKVILESVLKGESTFLRTIEIKPPESYKLPDPKDNIYKHAILWNATFKKTTGTHVEAPYYSVKVPLKIKNKSSLKTLIDSIENEEVRLGLVSWVNTFKRSDLPIMYMPKLVLESSGIPREVVNFLDQHRIIEDIVNMLYIVLETLGYYRKRDYLMYELEDEHYEDKDYLAMMGLDT